MKTGFRRLPLLIFALLLLLLCGCTADNPGESVKTEKKETAENIVSEKSPWGRWGAILPVPFGKLESLIIGPIYRNSGQEIIISYAFGPLYGPKARTTRFFNFSQDKLELECEDQKCYEEMISRLNRIELERLEISLTKYTLSEGGFRKRVSGGLECDTPMDVGYEISLPNGKKDYKKIIWMSSDKYNFQSSPVCNEKFDRSIIGETKSAKEFFNNVGNIFRLNDDDPEYIHANSIEFNFYSLSNETILGIAYCGTSISPVVIIFNNDLTSPFFENQTNVIRLDGDLTDSIYRVCSADARLKMNPGQTALETADVCFIKTIKNGISDDLKKIFDKKLEQFYVNKEAYETTDSPGGKWGTFLPLPKGARSSSSVSAEGTASIWDVYRNSNNEIILVYSFYIGEDRFWRVFNFSHDKLEYECKVNEQCSLGKVITGFNSISGVSSPLEDMPLGGGFSLKTKYYGGYHALKSGGYEITSPNGDVRYEMVIWASQEKHEFGAPVDDELYWDAKEINHINAEALYMNYYKLDEKTLLGHATKLPIVIIFRNDMTSPYFHNNRSLIQIDGKRALSVYDYCISKESHIDKEALENADKCFVEFLKGEYPWLD